MFLVASQLRVNLDLAVIALFESLITVITRSQFLVFYYFSALFTLPPSGAWDEGEVRENRE